MEERYFKSGFPQAIELHQDKIIISRHEKHEKRISQMVQFRSKEGYGNTGIWI